VWGWGFAHVVHGFWCVLRLCASLRLQTMAPVKLPVGYKCRLFGSSRNSLGLGGYGCDHSDGRSANSIPPRTPAEGEVNAAPAGPSAVQVTVISSDDDKSSPTLLIGIEGSTLVLSICIKGDSNICVSSTAPKKRKADSGRCSSYDSNRQFQDVWAAKLPWVKPHLDGEGVLVAVNCKICSAINGKPKLIVPKWDNLEKHMGKRRALVDLPKKGAKKGQCYWDKNCKHVKNQELFVSRKADTVLQMVRNTIVGESRRKFVQLAMLFHVLSHGCPMMEYEALRDLLKCLKTKHLPTKHWSDNSGWELAEYMHLVVLEKLKATVRSARFIAISCDEVTSCDSGQWLSLHAYVIVDWIRVPVLLHLSKIQDQGADALTEVIIRALMSEGGLSREEIGKKLICFGIDGVSVFQGASNGCIA
jgi:hypothetical protein